MERTTICAGFGSVLHGKVLWRGMLRHGNLLLLRCLKRRHLRLLQYHE